MSISQFAIKSRIYLIELTFFPFKVPQNTPPVIHFAKKQFYVGEKLVANCTTSRAKPVPHVVWLINGKKVNKLLKQINFDETFFLFDFVSCS